MSLEIEGFQTDTGAFFSETADSSYSDLNKIQGLELDISLLRLSGGITSQKWEFAVAGFLGLPAPKSCHGDSSVMNAQPWCKLVSS